MPKFRIVTPAGASFSTAGGGYAYEMEALEGLDAEIVECPATQEGFIAAARDADAIYAKGMKFNMQMIQALAKCRLIALGTVGVDYIDVAAATEKGIPVTNCPDTFIEEVADHAMMLLLATHRRAIEQDRMVREGRWTEGRPQLLKVPRLMGQTLGFIGFGRVARAVAERARPFGLRMMAFDPFLDELVIAASGVEPASLAEMLGRADFISMHLPATPEAVGFLKEQHFRQMKPNAIFINTGRGPTVVESALIKALQEKWIAGAGLDVLQVEPVKPDNPLLEMPHIVLSPHNASASARFDPARKRRVGQELALVLSGRWPMSCVNPTVLPASGLRRWQPISMHLPATPEAVGFLKEQHFRQMKPNAIFINTGRGPTVVESALIKALQEQWIAGAGLDVLQVEPAKPDNPLLKMPHVILSPHNASASARFDAGRRRRVGQELALVLSGRWPMSCVNPTVLPASGLRRWQPISMQRGPNA